MPCFHPIEAYQHENGGSLIFSERINHRKIDIPCGQCIGCRIEHSRQWAMRMVHEASMHSDNCFITLTYNPENLPPDGGLIKKDFQNFMKRLRKHIAPKKVRYYHCGEYGDTNNRPHYHAILFGYNFDDWVYLFDSPSGSPIYTSPTLERIWKYGFVTIGEVTFESAAYCARYVVKKIKGKKADEVDKETGLKPYERINSYTGEISEVLPEYSSMSRRPGIGYNWISTYRSDCYPKDFTTIRGARMKPPKYYDRYLESIDPEMYDDIKAGRQLEGYLNPDGDRARLPAREQVKLAQSDKLKRSL
jgi:hypothetical protein